MHSLQLTRARARSLAFFLSLSCLLSFPFSLFSPRSLFLSRLHVHIDKYTHTYIHTYAVSMPQTLVVLVSATYIYVYDILNNILFNIHIWYIIYIYICIYIYKSCNFLIPGIASTLQRTAAHYITLQRTVIHTTHCNLLISGIASLIRGLCNALQHTATYCNILQHTATHCNLLVSGFTRITRGLGNTF